MVLCANQTTIMSPENPFPERLSAIFEAEVERLKADIKKNEGEYDHTKLKGATAERVARDFLRSYFPPEYGFGNGQIIDSGGKISNEIDIAICNPSHPFTYIREGRGIFFIETVDAVVEVKSTITNVEDLISHCKSVRRLEAKSDYGGTYQSARSFDRIDRTPYVVFAFGSDLTSKRIIEQLNNLQDEEHEYIDLVYVVDEFLIHYKRKHDFTIGEHFTAWKDEGGYLVNEMEPDLLMFLLLLSDKMPDVNDPTNPLAAYISPEGYRELRSLE